MLTSNSPQCNANYRSFDTTSQKDFSIRFERWQELRSGSSSGPSSAVVVMFPDTFKQRHRKICEMPEDPHAMTDSTQMACFKRIHSVSTVNPIAITDKIEQMLDVAVLAYWPKIRDGLIQSQVRETDIRHKILQLRYTLGVIGAEANTNDVCNRSRLSNFSDQRSHAIASIPLIESLQQIIGLYHHTRRKPFLSFHNAIDSYVRWAMERIPGAYQDEPATSDLLLGFQSIFMPRPIYVKVPWCFAKFRHQTSEEIWEMDPVTKLLLEDATKIKVSATPTMSVIRYHYYLELSDYCPSVSSLILLGFLEDTLPH